MSSLISRQLCKDFHSFATFNRFSAEARSTLCGRVYQCATHILKEGTLKDKEWLAAALSTMSRDDVAKTALFEGSIFRLPFEVVKSFYPPKAATPQPPESREVEVGKKRKQEHVESPNKAKRPEGNFGATVVTVRCMFAVLRRMTCIAAQRNLDSLKDLFNAFCCVICISNECGLTSEKKRKVSESALEVLHFIADKFSQNNFLSEENFHGCLRRVMRSLANPPIEESAESKRLLFNVLRRVSAAAEGRAHLFSKPYKGLCLKLIRSIPFGKEASAVKIKEEAAELLLIWAKSAEGKAFLGTEGRVDIVYALFNRLDRSFECAQATKTMIEVVRWVSEDAAQQLLECPIMSDLTAVIHQGKKWHTEATTVHLCRILFNFSQHDAFNLPGVSSGVLLNYVDPIVRRWLTAGFSLQTQGVVYSLLTRAVTQLAQNKKKLVSPFGLALISKLVDGVRHSSEAKEETVLIAQTLCALLDDLDAYNHAVPSIWWEIITKLDRNLRSARQFTISGHPSVRALVCLYSLYDHVIYEPSARAIGAKGGLGRQYFDTVPTPVRKFWKQTAELHLQITAPGRSKGEADYGALYKKVGDLYKEMNNYRDKHQDRTHALIADLLLASANLCVKAANHSTRQRVF